MVFILHAILKFDARREMWVSERKRRHNGWICHDAGFKRVASLQDRSSNVFQFQIQSVNPHQTWGYMDFPEGDDT